MMIVASVHEGQSVKGGSASEGKLQWHEVMSCGIQIIAIPDLVKT